MIDHVEALLAAGIVDRGDVGDVDEAQGRVVAEMLDDVDDLRSVDVDRQLIERNFVAGRCARQRRLDGFAKFSKFRHLCSSSWRTKNTKRLSNASTSAR